MPKHIAVLVRDRQGEALRMSVGITLMDDIVDIYVLDRKVADNEENTMNLEMIQEMELKVYTNCKDNAELEFISTEDLAKKLLTYDNILPY
jgi:hypothetical protein